MVQWLVEAFCFLKSLDSMQLQPELIDMLLRKCHVIEYFPLWLMLTSNFQVVFKFVAKEIMGF